MRLIDADALKEKAWDVEYSRCGYVQVVDVGDIDDAPTIDPASLRPRGEWIMRGGKRYCTHCGERACVTRDTDDFWYTKGTDFCPNCGADMRKVSKHDIHLR